MIVPLVTPVSDGGSVVEADVAAVVGAVVPHADVLLPALSTGEGWALDPEQWRDMVRYTVRHAGDLPVVAGILRPTTAEVLARADLAAACGVRAVAVTTPFGPDVSQADMYQHFAELAARSSVPLVVYNESAVSGNELELYTLRRVCRLARVLAVKESSGDAGFTRTFVRGLPGVGVWQGWEHLLLDGGPVDGFAVGLANVEPELVASLFHAPSAWTAARVATACRDHALSDEDWYVNIKAHLHAAGVISTPKLAS